MRQVCKCFGLAVLLAGCLTASAQAGDDGWKDVAEFSLVSTSGNSESTSIGFKNIATREFDAAVLTIRAGGIRVDSTTKEAFLREDVITTDVTRREFDTTTAENYFLNGRYDHNISDVFFWYVGAGWDRNEFAGIDNRLIAEGGVGNIWRDDEDVKFRTNYGLTFTKQEDVFEIPGADDTFLGWRAGWDYLNKLNGSTTYTNVLTLDGNFDESSDYRADMLNGLSVAMSDRLGIKLGLQLLYDHMPSFENLEVRDFNGNPQAPQEFRQVELDDLDTIFTVGLTINF